MDIKALLAKSGCKAELVDSICEALDSYKSTIQEQCKAEYTAKLKKAQQVCLEETEAHKRELSRRLEIFCEAKGNAIEAHLKKQSALSESEATTKLRQIKLQLEGVEVNGLQSGQLAAETAKFNRQIQKLTEERDRAIAKANKQTAIAEKVLKHNRTLVQKAAIAESAVKPQQRPAGRIDAGRSKGKAVTTRPTLTESQDRRPPQRQQSRPNVVSHDVQTRGTFGISDIAAAVDDLI